MNYYPHHIGDFNSGTRHLSRLERSIYRDMLDMYYEKEQPLPADERLLFRRLIIRSEEEISAARQVLEEFFVPTEAGWVNARCAREIEDYRAAAEARNAGGRAKAWQAADKAIRGHIDAQQLLAARSRLADFVRQFGETEQSLDIATMLDSLTNPPRQPGFQFELPDEAQAEQESTAIEAHENHDATQVEPDAMPVEPDANRKVTAVEPRLANGEGNQNQNHNHNQNQNQNQNHPPTPSTLIGEARASPVELSIALRKAGVQSQPANPKLIELANQGVSVATVVAACQEGRHTIGNEQMTLGYVIGILKRWSREAKQLSVTGVQAPPLPARAAAMAKDEARRSTIAGLTGGHSSGPHNNIIDITPRTPGAPHQLG